MNLDFKYYAMDPVLGRSNKDETNRFISMALWDSSLFWVSVQHNNTKETKIKQMNPTIATNSKANSSS
jgi:hypothetical protein